MVPTLLISARLAGRQAPDVELAATILAREHAERGVVASNRGGWHPAGFASWCGPAGHAVLDAARALVEPVTVMRRGDALVPAAVGWVVWLGPTSTASGTATLRTPIRAPTGPASAGSTTAARPAVRHAAGRLSFRTRAESCR